MNRIGKLHTKLFYMRKAMLEAAEAWEALDDAEMDWMAQVDGYPFHHSLDELANALDLFEDNILGRMSKVGTPIKEETK
jgi:hypothetical protein